MKSENLSKWEPIENIPSELFLDSIIDDYKGVNVILRGENSEEAISIEFGLFVLSYQSTTESCILKDLDDNILLKSIWPLFVTDDSSYINWLVKQSYRIIEGESKLHYIIKHADGMIEVVSTQAPEVRWILDK
ncbi:hypothetical protein OQX61_24085 [Pedobacter sp. PLR]|uniref:hypothetical protein n=1 Tax=Pedobacter sp. PLR TaxID=2994465 RepID=UPI002247207D|nr:hypothetical protein [Pedobacter sp. PLR]MCX2454370.1 hypothetical protein [Pedobacter sp. PLR]